MSQSQSQSASVFHNPIFRIVSVWMWWIVGAGSALFLILAILGRSFSDVGAVMHSYPHLVIFIEFSGTGLLPLVYSLACRDSWAAYGVRKSGSLKSMLSSIPIVAAVYAFNYFTTGTVRDISTPAIHLAFPLNILFAVFGILVYGPLEMFFITWLITNTEHAFKEETRVFSWGLIITTLLFGLSHIITTASVSNAVFVCFVFTLLGAIFKYTRNSIGPMIAWTLINGYVFFLARLLWS